MRHHSVSATAAARREIVEVCRRLYERGLIAGAEGNVSVRISRDRLLVTPAGVAKVDLRPGDLVEVAPDGRPHRAGMRPSTELRMHLRIYARRPDVLAVVHAHPPAATAFAVSGQPFVTTALPEIILLMGTVPLVPYAAPGTEQLAERLEPFIDGNEAVLLANHGATTMGASLGAAHQRMESLEHCARILLAARLLGGIAELSPDDLRVLAETRERAGTGEPPRRGAKRLTRRA